MAQRISRAKQRIKVSGAPFVMPTGGEWAERLRSVLHVLYLLFTEGYAASTGARVARSELSAEAIRLTRMVHASLPDDPEVAGLLALMLLNEARRPARTGRGGELVPLPEQSRSRWDRALIAEGVALVSAALPKGAVGEYQLQAAIAAVHDEAETADETDWPQILALYGLLEQMTGNPMVTLNRAVAAAMVDGPAAGLALLEGLDERLAGHRRPRRRARAPAGDGRRPGGGDRALPDGGRANDERGRTALPADPRGTSDGREPLTTRHGGRALFGFNRLSRLGRRMSACSGGRPRRRCDSARGGRRAARTHRHRRGTPRRTLRSPRGRRRDRVRSGGSGCRRRRRRRRRSRG